MTPPIAVPVWVKFSETPELTGTGSVTEEERADGLLRLEGRSLVLEVEIVQSTTILGGTGSTTDRESLGTREYEIPFDRLVSLALRGGWWRPRLRLQTNSLRTIEGLTGAKRGMVDLRVARRNRAAARALVNEVEFSRADLAYDRARKLEGTRPGLPGD